MLLLQFLSFLNLFSLSSGIPRLLDVSPTSWDLPFIQFFTSKLHIFLEALSLALYFDN